MQIHNISLINNNKNHKNNTNNPTFGMALHMDELKIAKELGEDCGNMARKAKTKLENTATEILAKPLEIYVTPKNGGKKYRDRLDILTHKKMLFLNNPKNPVQRFLHNISTKFIRVEKETLYLDETNSNSFTEALNTKVNDTILYYHKVKHHRPKNWANPMY